MATKKDKKAQAKEAEVAKKENKKGGKKEMTPEEKAKKREARKEALKNRPAGQRPNSKQIDIIDFGANGKVQTYGYPVRKTGTLVTSVAFDGKGNIVSTAVTLVEGVKVKAKKGHGNLVPGVAGVGKKGKGASEDVNDEAEEDDEEEDED